MLIHKLIVGDLQTNCYILAAEGREAVVIDPGGDARRILDVINKNNFEVKYIINTHGHPDHTAADRSLTRATGVAVLIHSEDISLLTDQRLAFSFSPGELDFASLPREELSDGQILKLADLKIRIIHTPGHSRGSVSVLVEDCLFTGDLLFKGSVGRTDLPGGSLEMLIKSLREKVVNLPETTRILPGHGPETTLAEEKRNNPFLQNPKR